MIQSVKHSLKNSGLYRFYQRRRLARGLKAWSEHDQQMSDFYAQFIPPGSLCFDVGANIGNRVKIFLGLQARVVAIEPQADCVSLLRQVFGKNERLQIVQAALGAGQGEADLMIGDSSTLSTMSTEWIAAVRQSGRFSGNDWRRKQRVPVTTLDRVIAQFGKPAFIKMDVEGYEYQVLQGLTQPVSIISLEFVPEVIQSSLKCIEYLQNLGTIELNYSYGESMQFALQEWTTPDEIKALFSGFSKGSTFFGDLYVRFI